MNHGMRESRGVVARSRLGFLALGAGAALIIGGGCVAENDRITLGYDTHLEALEPEANRMEPLTAIDPSRPIPAQRQATAEAEGGASGNEGGLEAQKVGLAPSVLSLDRTNWRSQQFMVPIDPTLHHPTYREEVRYANETARQRGERPTADSSLELSGDTGDERLAEAFVSPFFAIGEAFLIVPRLFIEPQSTIVASPSLPYGRGKSDRLIPGAQGNDDLPLRPVQSTNTPAASPSGKPEPKGTPAEKPAGEQARAGEPR